MREGFTTGACAAAAALASCLTKRDGECPPWVVIELPGGRAFQTAVIPREGHACGVIKDAGDDPDITDGCEVRVRVDPGEADGPIRFLAGEGVGVVAGPGLKLPPGEAAINPVPRAMIERAVRSVIGARSAVVTVSIPGGEALAQRTFNPRLGVAGGLSILGTTGIVRPMSEDAMKETVALELRVRRSKGTDAIALTFGNQGEETLLRMFPGLPVAQISNFVGFALDEAAALGYTRILIAGHPGKLVKVAAGVMQTHSRYADARREAVVAQLARMGAPGTLLHEVYGCATTDAMASAIRRAGFDGVWNNLADAAAMYCEARVRGAVKVDAAFLDGGAVLGVSGRLRADGERWFRADGGRLEAVGGWLQADDGRWFQADGGQPSADDWQRGTDNEQHPADGGRHGGDGGHLPADGMRLQADDRRLPADSGQRGTDNEQRPVDGVRRKEAERMEPMDIEKRSMEIIESELSSPLPEDVAPIIKRVIHTTADFSFAENLRFTPGVVARMTDMLRQGALVVTDTNMALAGINKAAAARLGIESVCFMALEAVAEEASARRVSRARVSMERALRLPGPKLIVCGNAPSFLTPLLARGAEPGIAVIGTPVGFVNVVEAKEKLLASGIPAIIAMGRRGGSPVAAAIVNALMYGIEGVRA